MKLVSASIIGTAILIGGALILSVGNGNSEGDVAVAADNISIVDGVQIINISAKGGYSPRTTSAKADTPTLLKVATTGTFDCSSALTIPTIGYSANLPSTGLTEISVPPQKAGTTMRGLCSMGVYNFVVNFN